MRTREHEHEHKDDGDGRIIPDLRWLPHILQYTVLVLSVGGSWWYAQANIGHLTMDVNTLKSQVAAVEANKIEMATRTARIEAKLDYLIDEMHSIRQRNDRIDSRTQGR